MRKTRDLIKLKGSLRGISVAVLPDQADCSADIEDQTEQLDIKNEKDQNQNIRKVKQGLQTDENGDLRFTNNKLKKFYKKLDRIVIEKKHFVPQILRR